MNLIEIINAEGRTLKIAPHQLPHYASLGFRAARPEDVPPPRRRHLFISDAPPPPDIGELGDLCVLGERRLICGPKTAAGWGEPEEFVEAILREGKLILVEGHRVDVQDGPGLKPGDRVGWFEGDAHILGSFVELRDPETAMVLKDGTKKPRAVALADLAIGVKE